jgi:hypothetical protein
MRSYTIALLMSLSALFQSGCATKIIAIYDAGTLRETDNVSLFNGYGESVRGVRDDIGRFCTLQRDEAGLVYRERDYSGREILRKILPIRYRGNGYGQPAVSPDWRNVIYLDEIDKRLKKMTLDDLTVEVVAERLTYDDRVFGALFWVSNEEVFLEIEPSYDLEDKRQPLSEAVKINVMTRESKRVVLPDWLRMWEEGISPLRNRCAFTDNKDYIYILNLSDLVIERKVKTRMTPGCPIWSYDGTHIVYLGIGENSLNVYDLKSGDDRMVKQIHPAFGDLGARAMGGSFMVYYFGENGDPYRKYIRVLDLKDGRERTVCEPSYENIRLIDGGRKILVYVGVH